MTTRAGEISAASRALARLNRRRDGWEAGPASVAACCAVEGADRDDVQEVRAILIQLGIDPRREYDAASIRALVLTDSMAKTGTN